MDLADLILKYSSYSELRAFLKSSQESRDTMSLRFKNLKRIYTDHLMGPIPEGVKNRRLCPRTQLPKYQRFCKDITPHLEDWGALQDCIDDYGLTYVTREDVDADNN